MLINEQISASNMFSPFTDTIFMVVMLLMCR